MLDLDEPCVEWQGYRNRKGYGRVKWRGHYVAAHRKAYIETHGEIDGLNVHHLCHNPGCVNVAHLLAMTDTEHRLAHFGALTHCPQGHEYNQENTYWWGKYRKCRECGREHSRKYLRRING